MRERYPEDAFHATRILQPERVVPIHEGGIWMSVPHLSLHPGSPEHLVVFIAKEKVNTRVVVLRAGEAIRIDE